MTVNLIVVWPHISMLVAALQLVVHSAMKWWLVLRHRLCPTTHATIKQLKLQKYQLSEIATLTDICR